MWPIKDNKQNSIADKINLYTIPIIKFMFTNYKNKNKQFYFNYMQYNPTIISKKSNAEIINW